MKTIINVKWRMKKLLLTLLAVWCMRATAGAQAFDEHFVDSTLRLDYVLAGNNHEQQAYFCKASKMSRWAGRKNRLAEMPLKGNGQLILSDHATGRQLYVHTFSTLFQEWQATEEATRVNRAFNVSFNVPLPKHLVDVNITLTDFHGKVVGQLQHTVNPADILIRQVKEPQLPFRYVWKGQAQSDGEPDITRCIDLAIVAEGYTDSQMEKFYTDCQRVVDAGIARSDNALVEQHAKRGDGSVTTQIHLASRREIAQGEVTVVAGLNKGCLGVSQLGSHLSHQHLGRKRLTTLQQHHPSRIAAEGLTSKSINDKESHLISSFSDNRDNLIDNK